jgi:hypothetical protein
LNAGEDGFIPELRWMPPPELGSGKFGTPCERMHSLKARNPFWCTDWLLLPEDPQAAIAVVHVTATNGISFL